MAESTKTLERARQPRNGRWDWRRRYWDVGDEATIRPGARAEVPSGTWGEIRNWRVNHLGRVVYEVRTAQGLLLTNVLTEDLLPERPTPGEGSMLLTGRAARGKKQ